MKKQKIRLMLFLITTILIITMTESIGQNEEYVESINGDIIVSSKYFSQINISPENFTAGQVQTITVNPTTSGEGYELKYEIYSDDPNIIIKNISTNSRFDVEPNTNISNMAFKFKPKKYIKEDKPYQINITIYHRDLTFNGEIKLDYYFYIGDRDNPKWSALIDPITNVSGCDMSNATLTGGVIQCWNGNFTGEYIVTNSSIDIKNATIDSNDNDGTLLFNSTSGWINITNSTIDGAGTFIPAGIGHNGTILINSTNEINIVNSSLLYRGQTGENGYGGDSLLKIYSQNITKINQTYFGAIGGNGGVSGGDGLDGGNTTTDIRANIIEINYSNIEIYGGMAGNKTIGINGNGGNITWFVHAIDKIMLFNNNVTITPIESGFITNITAGNMISLFPGVNITNTSTFGSTVSNVVTNFNFTILNSSGRQKIGLFNPIITMPFNIKSDLFFGLGNQGGDQNYTFTNSTPYKIVPELNVSSGGSQPNDNLTCTPAYESFYKSPSYSYRWFKNGTLQTPISQILPNADTALADVWVCEVTADETFILNASILNTSNIFINDTIAPEMENESLYPTSAVTSSGSITIGIECGDEGGSIASAIAEYMNPNLDKINYTLILTAGNTYNRTLIPNIDGTWNITSYYCTDNNGNLNFTSSTQSFQSIAGGGGEDAAAGGGSGTTPKETGNISLKFGGGIAQKSILVWYHKANMPQTSHTEILVSNTGQIGANGKLTFTEELNEILTAKVCSIDMQDCSTPSYKILAGETKLLVLDGIYPPPNQPGYIGFGKEGFVRFVDQSNKITEFALSIERLPAFTMVNLVRSYGCNSNTDFICNSEQAAAGIAFLGLVLIITIIAGVFVR